MKSNTNNSMLNSKDEFTNLYTWSERTAVFFHSKKHNLQSRLMDSMIDLMCMAATTVALVNCL